MMTGWDTVSEIKTWLDVFSGFLKDQPDSLSYYSVVTVAKSLAAVNKYNGGGGGGACFDCHY